MSNPPWTRVVLEGMTGRETEHLRVLIANEIEVDEVGPVTARERPDVALVGLGESSQHALELIEKIVQEAFCPVILLIHEPNPSFVREASRRGIFAYITDGEDSEDPTEWQS